MSGEKWLQPYIFKLEQLHAMLKPSQQRLNVLLLQFS